MIDDIVVLTFVIYAVVLLLYLIENLPQYFFLYKYVVYNVDNTCMPLIIHLLNKQDFSLKKAHFNSWTVYSRKQKETIKSLF